MKGQTGVGGAWLCSRVQTWGPFLIPVYELLTPHRLNMIDRLFDGDGIGLVD